MLRSELYYIILVLISHSYPRLRKQKTQIKSFSSPKHIMDVKIDIQIVEGCNILSLLHETLLF